MFMVNILKRSIIFIDLAGFTSYSNNKSASEVLQTLNGFFLIIDNMVKKYGLEKIKTIGDGYMVASGLPEPQKDHAFTALMFASEAMEMLKDYNTVDGTILQFRCGIDCGPVVAGVIGEHKFIYDVWGDTVNTAARMEEYGEPGRIQVTERFVEKLRITNYELILKKEERLI
ncbi:MAG: adenylate/guanylate cyclase [Ignavibacteria bacterium]|nr:adenylate/guanylate cyclase [Ignavibacteria bacterium]